MVVNRCFMQNPPGGLTLAAKLVDEWFNPHFLLKVFAVIIVTLPLIYFGARLRCDDYFVPSFRVTQLQLINFLHQLTFSLVFNIALSAIIRQSRPCECWSSVIGEYVPVGDLYGMPSGSGVAAGVIAGYLLNVGPVFRIGSRIGAFLFLAGVGMNRVVLGRHSIGQVLAGFGVGVVIHFYSDFTPQWTLFLDNIVQTVLMFAVLWTNTELDYPQNDPKNLFAQAIWAYGFVIFVTLLMIWQFSFRHDWRSWHCSPRTIRSHAPESNAPYQTLGDSKADGKYRFNESDVAVTITCFMILCVILYLSYAVEQYSPFSG